MQSGTGWTLNGSGKLTVSSDAEWKKGWDRDNVLTVTIRNGVTSIDLPENCTVSENAFSHCPAKITRY